MEVTIKDLKKTTKKNGWKFNWSKEKQEIDTLVFKLVIENNENVIQGMVCLIDKGDHIYLNLIENAPFNIGENKIYEGVAGNLFAFACKLSFEKSYDGYVSFHAKTALITHYQTSLGATHLAKLLMAIETNAAKKLVERYFGTI